eukprot:Rmarinus@m.10858
MDFDDSKSKTPLKLVSDLTDTLHSLGVRIDELSSAEKLSALFTHGGRKKSKLQLDAARAILDRLNANLDPVLGSSLCTLLNLILEQSDEMVINQLCESDDVDDLLSTTTNMLDRALSRKITPGSDAGGTTDELTTIDSTRPLLESTCTDVTQDSDSLTKCTDPGEDKERRALALYMAGLVAALSAIAGTDVGVSFLRRRNTQALVLQVLQQFLMWPKVVAASCCALSELADREDLFTTPDHSSSYQHPQHPANSTDSRKPSATVSGQSPHNCSGSVVGKGGNVVGAVSGRRPEKDISGGVSSDGRRTKFRVHGNADSGTEITVSGSANSRADSTVNRNANCGT